MGKKYKKRSAYISKKYAYTGKPKLYRRYTDPGYGEGLHNRIIEQAFQVYYVNGPSFQTDVQTIALRMSANVFNNSNEILYLRALFGLCRLNGVKLEVTPVSLSAFTNTNYTTTGLVPMRVMWSAYGEVNVPTSCAQWNDDHLVVGDKYQTSTKYYSIGKDLVQTGYQTNLSLTGGKIWISTAYANNLPDFLGTLYIGETTPQVGGTVPQNTRIFTVTIKFYMSFCKAGYYTAD